MPVVQDALDDLGPYGLVGPSEYVWYPSPYCFSVLPLFALPDWDAEGNPEIAVVKKLPRMPLKDPPIAIGGCLSAVCLALVTQAIGKILLMEDVCHASNFGLLHNPVVGFVNDAPFLFLKFTSGLSYLWVRDGDGDEANAQAIAWNHASE
jgi:hypothetical protein